MTLIPDFSTPLTHDIELVFFDVDGTLLNSEGQYSDGLFEQIQRLQGQGIKTAIASGRPSYATHFLFEELKLVDIGVFCTGAEIFDPASNRHLQTKAIELLEAYRFYQRAHELGLYCEVYTPQHHYVDRYSMQNYEAVNRCHTEHLRVKPILIDGESLFDHSPMVLKFLLGRDKNSASPALEILSKEFPQLSFAFANFAPFPNWEFASVISHAADKQQAFNLVLQHYEIPAAKVMAIGDSHSDKVFLQHAGVGVAMGNANDDVKAVADYVTTTADEGGVALALECLVR